MAKRLDRAFATLEVQMNNDRAWHIVETIELGASAAEVWDVVGGFFNLHTWHPDISKTEIPPDQIETTPLRRLLTFPGQPVTTEELIFMDNERYHYRYKWYQGEWGEVVRNYVAEIRLFNLPESSRCSFQWSSTFNNPENAISEFYQRGFHSLRQRFPLNKA